MWGDTDLAYIAGLIDGEGCISLEPPGMTRTGKFRAPRARVIVSMTTPDVLHWLKATVGGGMWERKSRQPTQKPVWTWTLSGRAVAALLVGLLPYLKVKDEQARVAIAFLNVERPTQWLLTDSYRTTMVELADRMHELNRRGVA